MLSLAASTVYYLGVSWENRRRDKLQMQTPGASVRGLSEEEKKEMGDLNPDYRYWT